VLNGELTVKQAIFYAQRNTRRYAKRQMTWFRQEQAVEWFRGFGGDDVIQQAAINRVRDFLSQK
jgi:tRNA dimethylallyltransferase